MIRSSLTRLLHFAVIVVIAMTTSACATSRNHPTAALQNYILDYDTPVDAARTPVWLATDPIGGKESGKFFEAMRQVSCAFASNRKAIEALYATCEAY